MHALLIDDDLELARLLKDYLAGHGVVVDHAADGKTGLARLRAGGIDVVLLDVMLPGGLDGFAVCRAIRGESDVPVVMLTARGDDDDRIVGLELGADDYVPKPYNPRELFARMKAVVRRRVKPAATPRIEIGVLSIDTGARTVSLAGRDVEVTSFEFRLLLALAKRAGETVTREELAAAVRGDEQKGEKYDPSVDRSLDVHVSHLRQKLEPDPHSPRLIKTVRGVGYVLTRAPT